MIVYQVAPGSPAEQAGLQPNDQFVSIEGQAIDSVQKLQTLIAERLDQPSELIIQRGEEMLTLSLTPRSNPPSGQGAIGVILDNPTRPISMHQAANQSVIASYEYVRNLLILPVRMAQGEVSPEEGRLVGYKGMYDIYRRSTKSVVVLHHHLRLLGDYEPAAYPCAGWRQDYLHPAGNSLPPPSACQV